MSAVATPPRPPAEAVPTHGPAGPARPPGPRSAALRPPSRASLWVRLGAFCGLAFFAATHWASLVVRPPTDRLGRVVLIAALGGLLLALTDDARVVRRMPALGRRGALLSVRMLVLLASAPAVLIAAGLPPRYLRPRRLDDLVGHVDRGLAGIARAQWPYAGDEAWVRLTVLLAIPVVVLAAAGLAFYPFRRRATLARVGAIALLVTMYGAAVAERPPGEDLQRGALLFGLVAGFLWLPGLARREAVPGLAVMLAAVLVGLSLTARIGDHAPWVEYQDWNWLTGGAGATFDWTHSYGPIDWPRDGTTMLYVKSREPHYWKVQNLDAFDGLRWYRSGAEAQTTPRGSVPRSAARRFRRRVEVTVGSFRSRQIVGAGTTLFVLGKGRPVQVTGEGARVLGEPLSRGDSYLSYSYAPEPRVPELRAAVPTSAEDLRRYTSFDLPRPGTTARTETRPQVGPPPGGLERTVRMPLRGEVAGGIDPERAERERVRASGLIGDSPYAPVYRLARRLAAGQRSTYDVVRRIERHLRTSYDYSERPPPRPYPLADFLFRDREGYCQQFSGAMALMLRMNGVPARVAVGFSPGSYNRDTREYRVRDLDAHSWVEAWFDDIGWVAFDPTPPLSPAELQTADPRGPGSAGGLATGGDRPEATGAVDPSQDDAPARAAGAAGDRRIGLWTVPLGLLALVAAAILGLWARAALLRSRAGPLPAAEGEARELAGALRRLGYGVPAGTTLRGLEQRLQRVGGAAAAGYARALSDHRYAPEATAPPGPAERRALRGALAARTGLLGRLRALIALPPLPFSTVPRARDRASPASGRLRR